MNINTTIDFNEKKGFVCDMDGVIYHGNQILNGVREFIQWLHDEKKEYLFLTNNSGYTPRELNQKLEMVTHDNHLAGFADRIFHIIDGKIVKIEDRSEYKEDEQ